MPPSNFPLRWESTGDKWWYASPIDWAAANGHYDLVRELLRLDGNHLINLTSLRRIRRLEAVWDDEEQFHDVAMCRSQVAHQLFDECSSSRSSKGGIGKKKKNNSLIVSGYGGWLLYTAASAGDLGFVQKLLETNPLLVFGEGEYGLTDILYAAARSKNPEVFRVVYGYAVSPRFCSGIDGNEGEEVLPEVFMWEVKNRAVHAAARGGNLMGLKELLADCGDVLEYRDALGSTLLHAAAGRGQVEVVKHLIASYDMISSIDNEGNTPLHVAAYKGQLSVLEPLIQASPSSASVVNNVGDTFLHMAVAGFQTPGFRRLDRQIELMNQLITNKCFNIEDIINSQNNEGRTALHMAIIGNVHSNLVGLLMSARYIHLNIRDNHGLTPLDYLKQQPRSASSDMLIRQLISAGGISSCKDYAIRKAFASQLKMQGICSSPGTSFRVSDYELFLSTGIEHQPDSKLDRVSAIHFRSSSEVSQCDSTNGENGSSDIKKSGPLYGAAKRLKTMFHWPLMKRKETERSKKMMGEDGFSDKRWSTASEETLIPLRERFSLSSNKRTLAVRSNISSPTNRKKLASSVEEEGVFQEGPPLVNIQAQSPSSSFSKSSYSSHNSVEKGRGVQIEDEIRRPACSKQLNFDDTPNLTPKKGSTNKRFSSPILCFGGRHSSLRNSIAKLNTKQPVQSVA